MSLRNRFWIVSLAFVLSALILMFFVLSLVLTPPVISKLVTLDEEKKLHQLARNGQWQEEGIKAVESAEVRPGLIAVPLDDGRFLVSERPLNVWEALKVVRPPKGRGLLALVAWVGLLYGLATILSHFVNKPVKELVQGVRALAEGRRDIQVQVPEETELAELARGFNEMTRQLSQREKELEEALLAKERMFASTSHELRTPLTVILGYCQMLEEGLKGELSEPQRAGLAVITRNARGLLTQVEMLLTNSKLRAGTLPVELDRIELRELADELVEDLRPLAREKQLELDLKLPDQPVPVEVDPKLAGQIARNLIVNAIKFTPQGRIEVTLLKTDQSAEFCVKDTGPGVQVAFQERLFQEFSRGPNSEGIEGTGLGLALSQRLAQAMNGDVLLAENGEEGATFCWRTPLCES